MCDLFAVKIPVWISWTQLIEMMLRTGTIVAYLVSVAMACCHIGSKILQGDLIHSDLFKNIDSFFLLQTQQHQPHQQRRHHHHLAKVHSST